MRLMDVVKVVKFFNLTFLQKMKSEGKKFLNIFLLMLDRSSTPALKQSPCYVVRLACAVAFVLPLVFAGTFLISSLGRGNPPSLDGAMITNANE